MSAAISTEKKHGAPGQTLIVGVGNRLIGDEGIGPHIVDNLQQLPMPGDVRVLDCGCDLLNLVSHIDKPRKIVVVDAVRAGAEPGRIHRFDLSDFQSVQTKTHSAHQLQITDALRLLRQVYPSLADCEITVIGIEPKAIGLGTGLSKEVTENIADLTRRVLEEISEHSSAVQDLAAAAK